jgi:hypothetical protein
MLQAVGLQPSLTAKFSLLPATTLLTTRCSSAIKSQDDPSHIADLFRTANAVKRYTKGAVEVSADGSALFYKGEEINNVVVDRILKFMGAGLPVDPLIKFLERLLANPSRRSVEELYRFLEHEKLPITENGTFLGYKGVRENYLDVHSGKFDNSPGQTHEMARRLVDDDAAAIARMGSMSGRWNTRLASAPAQ